MSYILFKYLDIVGAKCMIGNQNLQFTNASQLNDPFDCHPKLIDYSNVPSSKLHGWIPEKWWIDKEETWELADKLGGFDIVRKMTLTCYNGIRGDGCMDCPACKLRKRGLDRYLERRGK